MLVLLKPIFSVNIIELIITVNLQITLKPENPFLFFITEKLNRNIIKKIKNVLRKKN